MIYDHFLSKFRKPIPKGFAGFKGWVKLPPAHFNLPRAFKANGEEIPIIEIGSPEILPTLFDLSSTKQTFKSARTNQQDVETHISGFRMTSTEPTKVHTYALANLGKYGNFQAHGPMHVLLPYITALNRNINPTPPGSHQEPLAAVVAGNSQGYQLGSHRWRSDAKHHDAQLGEITGFVGGAYRHGAHAEGKYQALKQRLDQSLPYDRFREKVRGCTELHRRVRLEINYHVDMDKIPKNNRNGR